MTVIESRVGAPAPSGAKPMLRCDDDAARLWKDVFAQGRVVEAGDEAPADGRTPRDPGQADEAGPTRGRDQPPVDAPVRDPASAGQSDPVSAGFRSVATSSGTPAAASIAVVPASVLPVRGDTGAAVVVNGVSAVRRAASPATVAAGDEPSAVVVPPFLDDLPVPEEVVQVHEADGALSFVIRDRSLADAAAVRCALETARRLTGDSRAVRQVTLNGRTIYTDTDVTPTPRVRGTGASFTC